ncbi:MAG: hypothetical protein F4W90_05215 [Gammaproteobacteria bacterium]|nr:hypothetical protein [Gammaproteobacteria bacterium]
MSTKFLHALTIVWSVALAEIRINVRLVRTWLFITFAAFVGVANAIEQFSIYAEISTVSPTAFLFSPYLIPRLVFPDFQVVLTFGLVFLAVEIISRDRRARLDQVIGTLPITNLQLVTGRTGGMCLLLFIPIIAFIGVYTVAGYAVELFAPRFMFRAAELFSTLAVLSLDAMPYLLFWSAIVVFTTIVIRNRAVTAGVSLALIFTVLWAQNNAPMYWLDTLGTYFVSTHVPSAIAQVYSTAAIVWHRVVIVVFAFALLCWSASLYPRRETHNAIYSGIVGCLLVTLAIAGFTFGHLRQEASANKTETYRTAHESVLASAPLDLQSLDGNVHIRPGASIAVDLTATLLATQALARDGPLHFSLNPSYRIETLKLNHSNAKFSFENGLLSVYPNQAFGTGETIVLHVEANGSPDTNFAYLDSELERRSLRAVDAYMLLFLGDHAAINHSNYVALTPAIAWYPTPGPYVNLDSLSERPRDFFRLDIEVQLPPHWHVAGPGAAVMRNTANERIVRFMPQAQIHQVGLFASDFVRHVMTSSGIEWELLVSQTHADHLEVFTPIVEMLAEDIAFRIETARNFGLEYPFNTYTVVETPTYLRTYGGGWQMPPTQSLPGIFLLREGTLLEADFRTAFVAIEQNEEWSDRDKRERQFALVRTYFQNDILGGDIHAAFTRNLFEYQTQPTGATAERLSLALNYVVNQLINESNPFHSAYVLKETTAFMTSLWAQQDLARENTQHSNLGVVFFESYINRPNVWECLFTPASAASCSEAKERLHAAQLYGLNLGELILASYGQESIGSLLMHVVSRYRGTSFTVAQLFAAAEELGIPLRDEYGDLILQLKPAGFIAHDASVQRIADADDGSPMYETSFLVQNDEPQLGRFVVEYATQHQAEQRQVTYLKTKPIRLAALTTIEVAVQTEQRIEKLRLVPFFSKNRMAFDIPIHDSQTPNRSSRGPKPFTKVLPQPKQIPNVIVVDDLDQGFTVDPNSSAQEPFLNIEMIAFTRITEELGGFDQGLHAFGGMGPISLTQWSRQQVDSAYGKYRKTLVRAEASSTNQSIHFDAQIPQMGAWELNYHLPNVDMVADPNRYRFHFLEQQQWPDYEIFVSYADTNYVLPFDGASMRAGWNSLGSFNLMPGKVRVTVTTNTASRNGTIVADAIRWHLYDEVK